MKSRRNHYIHFLMYVGTRMFLLHCIGRDKKRHLLEYLQIEEEMCQYFSKLMLQKWMFFAGRYIRHMTIILFLNCTRGGNLYRRSKREEFEIILL